VDRTFQAVRMLVFHILETHHNINDIVVWEELEPDVYEISIDYADPARNAPPPHLDPWAHLREKWATINARTGELIWEYQQEQ